MFPGDIVIPRMFLILGFILEYMTYNEYPSDRIAYDALSMFI